MILYDVYVREGPFWTRKHCLGKESVARKYLNRYKRGKIVKRTLEIISEQNDVNQTRI